MDPRTEIDSTDFLTKADVLEEYTKTTGKKAPRTDGSFATWAINEIITLGKELGAMEVRAQLPTLVSDEMEQEHELRTAFEATLTGLQKSMLEKKPERWWQFYATWLEKHRLGKL